MKKVISSFISLILLVFFVACGNSQNSSTSTSQSTDSNIKEDNISSSSEITSDTTSTDSKANRKMLVAYFSLAGEQYQVGKVDEGSTSIMAHMIAEETGADLFEIKAEKDYPQNYDDLLEISRK